VVVGGHAVRADMLERFAAELRVLARAAKDGFTLPGPLASLLGLGAADMAAVMGALEYRPHQGNWLPPRRKRHGPDKRQHRADSPFAVLRRP